MARRIFDFDNVIPEDSDYIYGDIKDDDGSGNGTPMNRKTFADMFQFFQRLMERGGVTPNRLPDNAYSGFQLNQALENLIKPESWKTVGGDSGATTFNTGWTTGSLTLQYRKDFSGVVRLRGFGKITSGSNTTIFTLPLGYRPTQVVYLVIYNATDDVMAAITVDTSGNVSLVDTPSATKNFVLDAIRFDNN